MGEKSSDGPSPGPATRAPDRPAKMSRDGNLVPAFCTVVNAATQASLWTAISAGENATSSLPIRRLVYRTILVQSDLVLDGRKGAGNARRPVAGRWAEMLQS